MTYEERKQQEQANADAAFALVKRVATAFVGRRPSSEGWKTALNHDARDVTLTRVLDTGERVIITLEAGGYRREGRLVASTPTSRHVQFAPNEWDTVRIHAHKTTITMDATRDIGLLAADIERRLLPVALDVTRRLDAKQAEMSAARDVGAAVVNTFLRAGWQVQDLYGGQSRVRVPDDHVLRRIGVTDIAVDRATGRMEYAYRVYLPSDTTAETLITIARQAS